MAPGFHRVCADRGPRVRIGRFGSLPAVSTLLLFLLLVLFFLVFLGHLHIIITIIIIVVIIIGGRRAIVIVIVIEISGFPMTTRLVPFGFLLRLGMVTFATVALVAFPFAISTASRVVFSTAASTVVVVVVVVVIPIVGVGVTVPLGAFLLAGHEGRAMVWFVVVVVLVVMVGPSAMFRRHLE